MKKLFSLLALSTVIAFTANAQISTNDGLNAGPASDASTFDFIDAESEALGSILSSDELAPTDSYFNLDSSIDSPERDIYTAGVDAISKLSDIENTWKTSIEKSAYDKGPYQGHRQAALQDQLIRNSGIIAKVGKDAQARVEKVLDLYNARFKNAQNKDEEFIKVATEATETAKSTTTSRIASFTTGVDAKVLNMGYGHFTSSAILGRSL